AGSQRGDGETARSVRRPAVDPTGAPGGSRGGPGGDEQGGGRSPLPQPQDDRDTPGPGLQEAERPLADRACPPARDRGRSDSSTCIRSQLRGEPRMPPRDPPEAGGRPPDLASSHERSTGGGDEVVLQDEPTPAARNRPRAWSARGGDAGGRPCVEPRRRRPPGRKEPMK